MNKYVQLLSLDPYETLLLDLRLQNFVILYLSLGLGKEEYIIFEPRGVPKSIVQLLLMISMADLMNYNLLSEFKQWYLPCFTTIKINFIVSIILLIVLFKTSYKVVSSKMLMIFKIYEILN